MIAHPGDRRVLATQRADPGGGLRKVRDLGDPAAVVAPELTVGADVQHVAIHHRNAADLPVSTELSPGDQLWNIVGGINSEQRGAATVRIGAYKQECVLIDGE